MPPARLTRGAFDTAATVDWTTTANGTAAGTNRPGPLPARGQFQAELHGCDRRLDNDGERNCCRHESAGAATGTGTVPGRTGCSGSGWGAARHTRGLVVAGSARAGAEVWIRARYRLFWERLGRGEAHAGPSSRRLGKGGRRGLDPGQARRRWVGWPVVPGADGRPEPCRHVSRTWLLRSTAGTTSLGWVARRTRGRRSARTVSPRVADVVAPQHLPQRWSSATWAGRLRASVVVYARGASLRLAEHQHLPQRWSSATWAGRLRASVVVYARGASLRLAEHQRSR